MCFNPALHASALAGLRTKTSGDGGRWHAGVYVQWIVIGILEDAHLHVVATVLTCHLHTLWWFTNLFTMVWRSSECRAMITAGQNLPDHLMRMICHDMRQKRLVENGSLRSGNPVKYVGQYFRVGEWFYHMLFVTTWMLAPIYSYPFLPSVTMQDFVKAYLAYKKELLNWHSAAASENHYHHKPFGVEMEHFTS